MVSFSVDYVILFVTIGISFCSEIWPMLGKACGKISWKGRVLTGERERGGLGIYCWWGLSGHRRSCWGICCVHCLDGCF